MTIGKSGLQVHDLSDLETMGVLDTAIENASMRRYSSPAAVAQTEAGQVHGGITVSKMIIAGYFPPKPTLNNYELIYPETHGLEPFTI
jgi:hypothetical protein